MPRILEFSFELIFYLSLVLDLICLSVTCRVLEYLNDIIAIVLLVFFATFLLFISYLIWKQPQNESITTFKIPFVHIFPFLSVFVNLYLMMLLSVYTWLRFSVWFVLGIIVYFSYGVRQSSENQKNKISSTAEEPLNF